MIYLIVRICLCHGNARTLNDSVLIHPKFLNIFGLWVVVAKMQLGGGSCGSSPCPFQQMNKSALVVPSLYQKGRVSLKWNRHDCENLPGASPLAPFFFPCRDKK